MSLFTEQIGTLLGPLTTAWAIPETCTVNLRLCSDCTDAFQGQQCVTDGEGSASLEDNFRCWPPTQTRAGIPEPTHPLTGWGFYSPGLECPIGYTSACTAIHGQMSEWPVQFALQEGETAIGCCPEGYSCTNSNGNKCFATVTSSTEALIGECSGTNVGRSTLISFPGIVTATLTNEQASETGSLDNVFTLRAPLYQLVFRESDLDVASTTIASRTTSQTTLEPQATESGDPASEQPENDGEGGLTASEQAGLGVGISLAVLLILALVALIVRRRRKQAATYAIEEQTGNSFPDNQFVGWVPGPPTKQEAIGSELESDSQTSGLSPAEMGGSRTWAGQHYGNQSQMTSPVELGQTKSWVELPAGK